MPGKGSPLDIGGYNSLAEKEREEDNGREDTCGKATLKGENNAWSTNYFRDSKKLFLFCENEIGDGPVTETILLSSIRIFSS